MHGEHEPRSRWGCGCWGSSPYARGARSKARATAATMGIIPVCTGSTYPCDYLSCRHWDHPRMHGEHPEDGCLGVWRLGSSPYARGARRSNWILTYDNGIIPVCTGSTDKREYWSSAPWDHPRMHGEHPAGMRLVIFRVGSSPYARGAPCRLAHLLIAHGIIPVCTGSTLPTRLVVGRPRDHPRMHGEHMGGAQVLLEQRGSSPYARGAPSSSHAASLAPGIIPVCTGSTRTPIGDQLGLGDHPRMHGEHVGGVFTTPLVWGSSPYARGAHCQSFAAASSAGIIPVCTGSTRYQRILRGQAGWIIPVCTGSTPRIPARQAGSGDHPRMHGEHGLTADWGVPLCCLSSG